MHKLLDWLFPPRNDEVVLRALSPETFLTLTQPQLVEYTNPATTALLPFHNPAVRAAIHEAKYHGNAYAFELLAQVLGDYLLGSDESIRRSIIVPIPLSKTRQKNRGFNQITEIVESAGSVIPIQTTLLERTRDTVSQVSLPRHERKENMRGAFQVVCPIDPSYTYIVVDDVVTTGATLQAAVDTLSAAGVTHIIPLALAH